MADIPTAFLMLVTGDLLMQEVSEICVEMEQLQQLLTLISGMLSGASNLKHASLGAELLPYLPVAAKEALHTLYLVTYGEDMDSGPHILEAVMECQQLRSLTIKGYAPGYQIPHLDLRQLTSLSVCTLKGLPAPGSLSLPQGAELALTISFSQIAGWSKQWQQVHGHVQYITIETHQWVGGGYMCTHREHLQEVWPVGINAFHGLQYLQIFCNNMMIWEGYDGLDLAHLAYIP